MHRRLVLSGIAVGSAGMLASTMLTQAQEAMGEAETQHANDTSRVGSLSLATSRLALEKASDENVRKFAEFEVAEQETVADVLKSMMMPADQAQGALMPPTDAEVSAMLDDAGRNKVAELEGLSGAEFDAAYLTAQLDGHNQLLGFQEEYLTNGQVREHLSVAKLARGQIQEHISHIEDLQAMMG